LENCAEFVAFTIPHGFQEMGGIPSIYQGWIQAPLSGPMNNTNNKKKHGTEILIQVFDCIILH
jgi:hypothetical protein